MSKTAAPALPAGAPNLEEILLQTRDMPWRAKSLKGVHEKMLWRDEATGTAWLGGGARGLRLPGWPSG